MTYKQSTLTISGATGSFGSSLARYLLATTDLKLRLIGRSESRLQLLEFELRSPRTTFILADIRDKDRLIQAFDGSDYVVHAAALKISPLAVLHTSEFVKTNVSGTINVVNAAIQSGVKKTLFISSDKAVSPAGLNAYGKSKAMGESLITEANMRSPHSRFASVRGGNVWGSRGSVVERWMTSAILEVTDPLATRFHLPMKQWMQFCEHTLATFHGGEVFTPKCNAWQLGTLAEAFLQHFPDKIAISSSARDGDKTHEVLIAHNELSNTVDIGWANVVQPGKSIRERWEYEEWTGKPVDKEISSDVVRSLTVDELRSAIANGG